MDEKCYISKLIPLQKLLFIAFLFLSSAWSFSQTATEDAVTFSEVTSGGGSVSGWTPLTNSVVDDNTYDTIGTGTKNKNTYYFKVQNFAFNIPLCSSIDGIEVSIKRYYTCAGTGCPSVVTDGPVKLIDASGTIGGTDHDANGAWATSEENKVFGNSTDKWGFTFNSRDINDPDFGIAFAATSGGANNCWWTMYVDYVAIKIYFTTDGGKRYSSSGGNWNNTATWGGASIPGQANCVYIESGYTVVADVDATCDELTIGIGTGAGTLNFNTANVDITVLGDLSISVNGDVIGSLASNNIYLEGDLTINKTLTNTSFSLTMQTNPGLTISGTGGIANLNVNTSTTNNGNLTISNTFGGTNNALINGAAGSINITGCNTLGKTIDCSTAGNTITVNNSGCGGADWDITSIATTFANLQISGTKVKKINSNITVNGNLTINGSTVGVFNSNARNINISGNWINNNTADGFNQSTGTVTFQGSASGQTISHAGGETFYSLSIANSSTGVTLNNTVTVSNVLTFSDGELILNSNTLNVTNSAAAAITGGSPSSYIKSEDENSILKWDIGTTTGNYEFPIGVGGVYIPFRLFNKTAGVGAGSYSLSLWYTSANATPPSGTSVCPDEDNTTDRFWLISLSGYTSNPSADVYFYYNEAELDGITEADLQVQRWDDTKTEACKWVTPTVGTVDAVNNYVVVTGLSSFSPWAMSKKSAPLPIELLSFNAQIINTNKVELKWITASEINNDFFTIEKTKDGKEFNVVSIIKSVGNSNSVKEYFSKDESPYPGISYYRLKQTDLDGKITFSDLIAIDLNKKQELVFVVHPNPSTGNIIFIKTFGIEKGEEFLLELYDIYGKKILCEKLLSTDENLLSIEINPAAQISPGVYLFNFSGKNELFNQRVIIH